MNIYHNIVPVSCRHLNLLGPVMLITTGLTILSKQHYGKEYATVHKAFVEAEIRWPVVRRRRVTRLFFARSPLSQAESSVVPYCVDGGGQMLTICRV